MILGQLRMGARQAKNAPLAMTKIYLQHTMRYLVVLVAIGLAAADDGPCFSHVAVRYLKDPLLLDNICFEQCFICADNCGLCYCAYLC